MTFQIILEVEELDDAALQPVLYEALNAAAIAAAPWFAAHPDAPCCLDCGSVRYRVPKRKRNIGPWPTPSQVLRRGHTGCAGAAIYRAGQLLAKGEQARVGIQWRAPGDWHAVVVRQDGNIEDPTKDMQLWAR